jgi:putative DNA primase/helicase
MSTANDAVAHAVAYIKHFHLVLVPTAPRKKYPCGTAWNQPQNWITDEDSARAFYTKNPTHGAAVMLAPSGLVAADIDDQINSPGAFRSVFGLDLEELKASTPCVRGQNYQLLFRAPAGLELKHKAATWPKREGRGNTVLFELRAGNVTTTVPPTVHPGTGRPYIWEVSPRGGCPELPQAILDGWLNWPKTQQRIFECCPWWTPPPDALPACASKKASQQREAFNRGESVIDAFNAAHDVAAILEAHGYRRDGKRFAAPDCKHAAGITLLPSGKVFCHNQGDVLASERAHDAFDLYVRLEHNGDFRSAVRAAAKALGMETQHGHR